jgi:hypothetical protein
MKVLDLQCALDHTFEGWFSSEADFLSQNERSMVQCPVCGDSSVVKRPSAPRLNLSGSRADLSEREAPKSTEIEQTAMNALVQEVTRHVLANTTDVGHQFAEEARKMHYGEVEARNIRGKATLQETRALVEEGIEFMPFALPPSLKEPLH